MSEDSEPHSDSSRRRRLWKVGFVAIASALWIAYRSGGRPSRIGYPCQQAAIANIQAFQFALLASLPSLSTVAATIRRLRTPAILTLLVVGSTVVAVDSYILNPRFSFTSQDYDTRVPIIIAPQTATISENATDIFVVQNSTRNEGNTDDAVSTLFDMMSEQGLHFYQTESEENGLIASDDVVLLKVNGQWPYRGGTNTDLLRSVIGMIIGHPDGFTGEVILADNGQGLGHMNRPYVNSFYRNISFRELADSFDSADVSTILWDDLRASEVDDFDEGDFTNGYVLSSDWDSDTEIYVSYPKFMTPYGSYVSFKNGVWDNSTGFDSDRLKIINMPILKTHFRYGVTASVKHYMGVPKGEILTGTIPHEHFSIALGGMATLMVETRAPVLNILDSIWVNARPTESTGRAGPSTSYGDASWTDIISASVDPVGLDYWASRNILIPTAEYLNYTAYDSIDPAYEPTSTGIMDESFHNYLERSMYILRDAGFHVTMNQSEINVYVAALADVITTTT
ncbi:MAG: DUF362 domain-containing protein, partial [Candidatus Thorarchaeota archaeon]